MQENNNSNMASLGVTEAVCALVRAALWGQTFPSEQVLDWELIYTELSQQQIECLLADVMAAADPEHETLYFKRGIYNLSQWHKKMNVQQDLIHLLEAEGIAVAVLKGSASSVYYPQPENRSMGDIDLLVKPKDFERALELLQQQGKYKGENYRHVTLVINEVVVELHRAYGMFNEQSSNQLLDTWLYQGMDYLQTAEIGVHRFLMLPPKENGLVLLAHISTHLENGLGLRQILDWMMYVRHELNDEFWNQEFAPAARTLGLEKLAISVTRMCQIYFGLNEEITWCRNADPGLCEHLLDYLFKQGNFGRKQPKGMNRTASVLSTSKNIVSLFQALQYRGCRNWNAIQKHPWLKPFAWLYQVIRYLRRGLTIKHPVAFVRQAMVQESDTSRMLDELGVYRMKNES